MKNFKIFLRNYYLAEFFNHFVFAYAIQNVYLQIKGLSVFEISLLLGWWGFLVVMFEIPSGALADRWSRRKMLIIAPFIKSLCFLCFYLAGGNFWIFGLGFLFWGISETFQTGTSEAFLYDLLVFYQKEDQYEKIMGRKNVFFHVSIALGCIIGGFMAHYFLDLSMILSILPLMLSAFFVFRMVKAPRTRSVGGVNYFVYIRLAFQELRRNFLFRYFCFYMLGISVFGYLEEIEDLYFYFVDLPIYSFGLLAALLSFVHAFGSFFAHRFKDLRFVFWLFPLLSSICLLLVGFFSGSGVFFWCCCFCFLVICLFLL